MKSLLNSYSPAVDPHLHHHHHLEEDDTFASISATAPQTLLPLPLLPNADSLHQLGQNHNNSPLMPHFGGLGGGGGYAQTPPSPPSHLGGGGAAGLLPPSSPQHQLQQQQQQQHHMAMLPRGLVPGAGGGGGGGSVGNQIISSTISNSIYRPHIEDKKLSRDAMERYMRERNDMVIVILHAKVGCNNTFRL